MQKTLTVALLFILMTPGLTEARWDVDRDDLDDEIVAEIPVPVLFFPLAYVIPDFGAPRGGGTRSHEGQDFLAPKGTPIVSPTEAIVIRTGTGRSAGKYVYTANPGGETFRYMHLDTIANIKSGDELDPGDFIGTVGDTGNAPDGAYHLHFEIRDEDNDPLDPYDRLTEEFSERQQVSFLQDIFREIRNDEEYARFLVDAYPAIFRTAYEKRWNLPREIDEELEDLDIEAELEAEQGLRSVLGAIPQVVQSGLSEGDDSVLVALVQLYLIYATDGAERDRLAAAGPTGYFGSITTDAMKAYQADNNLPVTGEYDSRTRGEKIKRAIVLNLDS